MAVAGGGGLIPPVLCYHRIGGPLELGVTRVGRRVFERQMATLARAGWRTLSLDEFTRRIAPGGESAVVRAQHAASLLPHEFLLTFDDGYASLADIAFPIVRDAGFTATTFLITDYVGRTNTWDVRYTWRRLEHLDWPAIERWQARGFTFGSHGATHRRLTWLSDAAVRDDLARARALLTERLGAGAGVAVAYPFGAVDGRVARIAAEVGHTLGFGAVTGAAERLGLPRLPVYLWDAGAVPLPLRRGLAGRLGRAAAHVANRCAVGTSVLLSLTRRRTGGALVGY